jgi:hypothetical protein
MPKSSVALAAISYFSPFIPLLNKTVQLINDLDQVSKYIMRSFYFFAVCAQGLIFGQGKGLLSKFEV